MPNDIGYCNTCFNPECNNKRIKESREDCPKIGKTRLAWMPETPIMMMLCNVCNTEYLTPDNKCIECGSEDYQEVEL